MGLTPAIDLDMGRGRAYKSFRKRGAGVLQIGETPQFYPVKPGDLVRIPPHTFHRITCTGSQPMRYLSVDAFLEGESKAEPTWDSHVRMLCEEFGWDFD